MLLGHSEEENLLPGMGFLAVSVSVRVRGQKQGCHSGKLCGIFLDHMCIFKLKPLLKQSLALSELNYITKVTFMYTYVLN